MYSIFTFPYRRLALGAGLLGAAALLLIACAATPNPYYNPAKAHHRPQGFENNYSAVQPKSLWTVIQWRWNGFVNGIPPLPQTPTPQVAPDLAFVHANARAGQRMQPAVTWIGHSTALVQAGGLNVLTDPHFSQRAAPVQWLGPQRLYPPGLALAQLPHIDVVLISHNHYDHLDLDSVRALNAQAGGPPLFVVPLGIGRWLAGQGIARSVELDWWDHHTLGGVELVLTPLQHWSARSPWDRKETLWGGFAVFTSGFNWFFSGDTGYSKDFADIYAKLAPKTAPRPVFDLALLAVGCYEPRWFMQEQHVNPDEAVRIHQDLHARQSLGVHWGTFQGLCDEPLDQAPQDLAAAKKTHNIAENDFFLLQLGETRQFSPP